MKAIQKFILLCIIINFINVVQIYAQEKKMLLLPLQEKMILLDKGTETMISYNRMNLDSVKSAISSLAVARFQMYFNDYKIYNVLSNKEYNYLNDSLIYFQKWNSLKVENFENSNYVGKVIIKSDVNPYNDYTGRYIADKFKDSIRSINLKNNYSYFALINKLEIKKKLFNPKKKIVLHFELYDKNVKRIYGRQFSFEIAISKRTYGDVFFYFLRNSFDEYFHVLKKDLFEKEIAN